MIFLCLKIEALGGDKTEITRESKSQVPLSQILSRARREKINSPGKIQILDPLRFARMLDSMICH